MVISLAIYLFLFFAVDCPVIDSVALRHDSKRRDLFVCSWGGIRVSFPATVACIGYIVYPLDGRLFERPTGHGSIPGK
jgi:hypothetical protein